ncbi:MAG TPA: hypothetical protein VJN90_01915 [Candidatus Acidoferrales bacterium]|nr:hypothetical protein [Candidatus Acidoferrales bacterium]
MKILLICKGEYRYFFPQIARALRTRHGCEISAMAFASPATRMLDKTLAFDSVFNLAAHLKRTVPESDLGQCVAALRTMELSADSTSANTMIQADRIIRRYPFERALRVLTAIRDFWGELLARMQPDAIVGEIACATEWVAWSVAQQMNIQYLAPYPTPVANKLFFLGAPDGVWQAMERTFEATSECGLSSEQEEIAWQFVRDFQSKKSKPPFLSWAQRSPLAPDFRELGGRVARVPFRLRTFIEDGQYEVGSHHGTAPWLPIWEDAMRILRHAASETAIFERTIAIGPKIYFPLHVQPEFTTDVRAPFFANQMALIESISKSAPAGYRVVVKEHPGMKGERKLEYYRNIKKIHNVQLLSPAVDSHDVIQQSDAVLTITGSSAWEGILYGKPVIAFGPLCYGFGDLVYRCGNITELPVILRRVLRGFKPDRSQMLRLVWSLLATAHELEWGDPIRQPQIREQVNVERAADAIISEVSSRTPVRLPDVLQV